MFTLAQFKNAALIAIALIIGGATTALVTASNDGTPPAVVASNPVQALQTLSRAVTSHDRNAFLSVVHAETPAGSALVTTTATLVEAQSRFRQALGDRFNPESARLSMEAVNFTAFQFGQNNLTSAETTVEGDHATVRIPSRSDPTRTRSHRMIYRNGGWRLDVDAKIQYATEKNLAAFKAVAGAIDRTTEEVLASRYGSIEQAVEALKSAALSAATSAP